MEEYKMTTNVLIYFAGFISTFALMILPLAALLWTDFTDKPVDKSDWN